jgi:biotin-dependent carboxylase-like uncharacterized protein
LIKIIDPGFNSTIQDMGRHGYYHLGVPPCGAADKLSFQIGNILIGNPVYFAGLEFALLGPSLEFQKTTVISITGAPAEVFVNANPIPMWRAVKVKKGDCLTFKPLGKPYGVFTYLCVSGGIQTPEMLGSRSTYTLSDFGGLLSRKIEADDLIEIGEPLPGAFNHDGNRVDASQIPHFSDRVSAHVVMGIGSERVSDEGIAKFLNNDWEVKLESNRVAYRLKGEKILYNENEPLFGSGNSAGSVVDFAYPIGAVLVPNIEEIIILLNDATVGGGFVTIGTIISTDLRAIAQARPGALVRFHAVTVHQATDMRLKQKKMLYQLKEQLK